MIRSKKKEVSITASSTREKASSLTPAPVPTTLGDSSLSIPEPKQILLPSPPSFRDGRRLTKLIVMALSYYSSPVMSPSDRFSHFKDVSKKSSDSTRLGNRTSISEGKSHGLDYEKEKERALRTLVWYRELNDLILTLTSGHELPLVMGKTNYGIALCFLSMQWQLVY